MRCIAIRPMTTALALATTPLLSGCLLGAAIEVAAETVEAGVEITGAVAGAAVDIVVPGDGKDDDDKKSEKDKKDKDKKDKDED